MDEFGWHDVLLILAIFFARVVDVSIGTLRTILLVRGYWLIASLLGFVEILIWLLAAASVLDQLDEGWWLAIAYAGGFAAGNMVGCWVDARLAIGLELVRAVSPDPTIHVAASLAKDGYEVTAIPARNRAGFIVEILLIIEKRKRVPALIRRIHELDPEAFCTVSEVRHGRNPPPVRDRRRRGPFSATAVISSKRK